jgi:hypothetical protein
MFEQIKTNLIENLFKKKKTPIKFDEEILQAFK